LAPNSINSNINSTKFLGMAIDDSLSWKDRIAAITSKIHKACYSIRTVKTFLSKEILRMVYFSFVHSVLSYGIIFWGNSHLYIINNVFKIKKSIIRINSNSGNRDSRGPPFKHLQILSLPSQYIFSLLVFVIMNRNLFQSNSELHNLNTHFYHNMHLPSTNLTSVQKGVLYSGSKIYNHLPSNIKALANYVKLF
jgi:hypothetical protein